MWFSEMQLYTIHVKGYFKGKHYIREVKINTFNGERIFLRIDIRFISVHTAISNVSHGLICGVSHKPQ